MICAEKDKFCDEDSKRELFHYGVRDSAPPINLRRHRRRHRLRRQRSRYCYGCHSRRRHHQL